jgi:DNA repair protein RadC
MPIRKRYDDGGMVASTILEQLGGIGRIKAMTGAYNFVDIGNGVSFRIKNQRANYVKIKLNSMDLYDLEIGRIRGDNYTIVSEYDNVYSDQLKSLIEKSTGMYLSFAKGGGLFTNKRYRFIYEGSDGQVHGINYQLFGIKKNGEKEFISEHTTQAGAELKAKKWVKTVSPNEYESWVIQTIKFEDGGIMASGGEIFQIKDSKDRYYSKMGWNDSPDLGYLYTLEDAEKLLKSLSKDFFNLQIVKYNKDWWKMADGGELSIKNKLSKSSFALPYQIAIYVPSTKDKNVVISDLELESRVDEVKKYLSELFGGFNSVKVEGGYESKDRGLIKEDAVRVVAFANKEDINQKLKKLISKIKYWCSEWGQESMGVEFENDMYYVDENTKFEDGGIMASGGKVDTQGNPYVNVYARMKAKDYFGVESKGNAVKWFKLNARPMTRKEAENWYQTKKYQDKLGKINVYIGNIEYSGQRRFIREDGGMMADGGKIKNTTLYIYSFDDGELILEHKLIRAKNLEEAEKIGRELFYDEVKNYYEEEGVAEINTQVQDAPYFMQLMSDKELRMPVYYAEDIDENTKFALGGYADLSKEKPSIMQDSKSFKVPEIDLVKIDDRTFKGSQIIRGSEDAVDVFRQFWNKNSLPISENLNVMFLNQANKVIGIYQHSKGSVNGTIADPEMIALAAVKSLAKGVIIAHNHPSGNLKPSQSDIDIANKIKNGLKLFDIKLLDSLIITEDSYNSLDDLGVMAKGGVLGKKYNIVKGNDGGVTTWVVKDQDGNKLADYFDRSEAFQFVSSKEFWDETYRNVVLKAIEEDNFTYYIESSYNYAYASDVKYYGESFSVEIRTNGIIKIDSIEVDDYIFSKEDWKIIGEFIKEVKEIENDEYDRGGKVKNKWIQEALKNDNQGALRRTAKRKGLLRGDENLSKSDLDKLQKMGGKTAKRAHLAETLRSFNRKK